MSKFLVAGVTQIETIVRVDKIPVSYAPLTSVNNSIFTAMGGDAYNESLALKWLGDDVCFMSIVGRNLDLGMINPPDRKITLSTEYIVPQMNETPTEVVLYDKDRKQQIFEDIKDLRDAEYDIPYGTNMGGHPPLTALRATPHTPLSPPVILRMRGAPRHHACRGDHRSSVLRSQKSPDNVSGGWWGGEPQERRLRRK